MSDQPHIQLKALPYSIEFITDWYHYSALWNSIDIPTQSVNPIIWIQSAYGLLCTTPHFSEFEALFITSTVIRQSCACLERRNLDSILDNMLDIANSMSHNKLSHEILIQNNELNYDENSAPN